MTEREFRISGRDYEVLSDKRLEEVLDDTGADCPGGDYCAAEVYALAREVKARRAMAVDRAARQHAWRAADSIDNCHQLGGHLWRQLGVLDVCRVCGVSRRSPIAAQ